MEWKSRCLHFYKQESWRVGRMNLFYLLQFLTHLIRWLSQEMRAWLRGMARGEAAATFCAPRASPSHNGLAWRAGLPSVSVAGPGRRFKRAEEPEAVYWIASLLISSREKVGNCSSFPGAILVFSNSLPTASSRFLSLWSGLSPQ